MRRVHLLRRPRARHAESADGQLQRQEAGRGVQAADRFDQGADAREQRDPVGIDGQADHEAQEADLQRGVLRLQHLQRPARGCPDEQSDPDQEGHQIGIVRDHRVCAAGSVKNLFDPADLEEIRSRVARLAPDSPRQWGKMTPAQMAAHCAAFMELALGDARPPRMFVGRLIGPIAKLVTIKREKGRVPRNSPTVPGYAIADQRDFEKERGRLRKTIDRLGCGPAGCTTHPHPFFGRLTPQEWAVLSYKHLDHHLRQFGV
ncbi:MAG TPA: DUF1569 domain-containing protein [Thermoanaerobaculia bacterium]